MKINTMGKLVALQEQWHEERGLIKGTDNETQAFKFLEEYMEFRAGLSPVTAPHVLVARVQAELTQLLQMGRIKQFAFSEAEKERKDAIGDMCNMLTGFARREGETRLSCGVAAYEEYNKRKGKMINGIWTKEEDL